MRSLCCVALCFFAACSSDSLKGHLFDDMQSESEKTNYPPSTLKEQTFVLTKPVGYDMKRSATAEEMRTALKRGVKLAETIGGERLIAVPVKSANGNTTVADVMVFDTRKQVVVGETVYRISYTPPSGQPLLLDGVTAIFEALSE